MKDKQKRFVKTAEELAKWLEERELKLGYTDTYLGQLAILINEKEDLAITNTLSKVRTELLEDKPKEFDTQTYRNHITAKLDTLTNTNNTI